MCLSLLQRSEWTLWHWTLITKKRKNKTDFRDWSIHLLSVLKKLSSNDFSVFIVLDLKKKIKKRKEKLHLHSLFQILGNALSIGSFMKHFFHLQRSLCGALLHCSAPAHLPSAIFLHSDKIIIGAKFHWFMWKHFEKTGPVGA